MATIISHALLAASLAKASAKKLGSIPKTPIIFACALLSILPDIDVIGFKFGIPYQSPYGHRGFTHSLSFSLIISSLSYLLVKLAYIKKNLRVSPWIFSLFLFSLVSHVFLDMMTNGGLGCAIYWPFSYERHFFPVTPIPVSPIGIRPSLIRVLTWEFLLLMPIPASLMTWSLRINKGYKILLSTIFILIMIISFYLRI